MFLCWTVGVIYLVPLMYVSVKSVADSEGSPRRRVSMQPLIANESVRRSTNLNRRKNMYWCRSCYKNNALMDSAYY